MGNAEKILVIILASALALFLVLSIIAVVKIIQVLHHLKHILKKAEKLANTAETVGEFFKYTAGPVAIAKLFSNVSGAVFKHRKKSKGSES